MSFDTHGHFAKAMSITVEETISQDGVMYYVQRARIMNVDEAVMALNNELDADPNFRECWRVSEVIYENKVRSNPFYKWENMEIRSHWALVCFLLEIPNISHAVNHFCRQALPEPASWNAFPLKGLWFFLLRGFESLPPFHTAELFRGVTRFTTTLNDHMPTLQFLSTSCLLDEAKRFALPQGLVLVLKDVDPLYMRDVRLYAASPEKQEVLIWPLATFYAGDRCDTAIEFYWLWGTRRSCAPRRRPR